MKGEHSPSSVGLVWLVGRTGNFKSVGYLRTVRCRWIVGSVRAFNDGLIPAGMRSETTWCGPLGIVLETLNAQQLCCVVYFCHNEISS